MAELAARAEMIKLAADLQTEVSRLAFLETADAEDLARLRRTISRARFARIEPRLKRLAASSSLLPLPATARLAKTMLGASLCGKIAGVLDVDTAIRFAGQYDAPFLAELSMSLDPERTAAVLEAIDAGLAIRVGVELLHRAEYLALGRLMSVAPAAVVEGVVARASAEQLLRIAFYTDDHGRLDEIVTASSDQELAALIEAAAEHELFEQALSGFTFLASGSQARLAAAVHESGYLGGFADAARALGVDLPEGLRS